MLTFQINCFFPLSLLDAVLSSSFYSKQCFTFVFKFSSLWQLWLYNNSVFSNFSYVLVREYICKAEAKNRRIYYHNMYISLKLFSLWLNICLNHPFTAYLEWSTPTLYFLCVKYIWEWFFLSTFKHSFNTYHECIYVIKRFPFGPIVKL